MNEPAVDSRVEELAANFREVVPLDDSGFPQRLDESAVSGSTTAGFAPSPEEEDPGETGPSRQPDPEVHARHPFEVYLNGFTSNAQTTANVLVARGDILKSEDDLTSLAAVTSLDTPQTLTSGERLWLHAIFTKSGGVTSVTLVKGTTWTFFPAIYKDNGPSGNEWITLLCQVRTTKKGKSSGDHPDSGEFPDLKADLKIAQKTHTHLAVARLCVGTARKMVWGLVPSTGGID